MINLHFCWSPHLCTVLYCTVLYCTVQLNLCRSGEINAWRHFTFETETTNAMLVIFQCIQSMFSTAQQKSQDQQLWWLNLVRGNKSNPLNTTELAWLKKCTPDYLKLSEVSTIRTFSSRKWTGLVLVFQLWSVKVATNFRDNKHPSLLSDHDKTLI